MSEQDHHLPARIPSTANHPVVEGINAITLSTHDMARAAEPMNACLLKKNQANASEAFHSALRRAAHSRHIDASTGLSLAGRVPAEPRFRFIP